MQHKFNLLSRMGMTNTPPCLRVNGSSKFLKSITLLFVLMLGVGNVWGTDPTVSIVFSSGTSSGTTYYFQSTSGEISNILSFSSAKNSSQTTPAYNSNDKELRLYYNSGGNGGSITLTAASGVTIKGFVLTTATTPTTKYTAGSGTATAVSYSNKVATVTNLSCTSLKIQNCNTTNTQLKIKSIVVTYSAGASHKVTLNTNGGTIASGKGLTSYSEGTATALPTSSDISKTGNTFIGWFDNENCTGTAITEIPSTAKTDVEYWAKWQVNSYTLTWMLNDGVPQGTAGTDYTSAGSVQYGATLTAPTLSKTGYTYTWNPTVPSTMPAANSTYEAVWTAKTTTVTLSAADATTAGSAQVTATYGQAMPTATMPKRNGYVFNGYVDSESSGTKYYNADGTSAKTWDKEDDTKTLYAQWTEKQSVTITFTDKIHKTSVDSKNVYTGETFEFPTITDKTKEEGSCKGLHYHFMGWVLSGDALIDANIKKANTTSANVTEAAEYLAVWAEGTTTEGTPVTHTLTKSNTNWSGYASGTQNDDKAYEWSYYASGSNVSGVYWWGIKQDSNNSNITSPTFPKDVTGVSVFVKNGSSKDTRYLYLCSSNSNTAPTSGDLGSVSVNPSNESELSLTLTDKSFKKFYLYSSAALSVKYIKVTYGGSSTTYSNYATECETTYAITKTADDHGTIVAKVADVAVTEAAAGKTVALSVTNLADNYELTGWTVKKTGDDQATPEAVNNNQFTMPAYPVTVTATITALAEPKYYIAYNANGGQFSVEKSAAVEVGQSITIESTIPTKADCTFKGWAWAQDATTADFVYADNTFTPASYTMPDGTTANKTLYAVWDEKQYTVTLVAGSGTSAASYTGPKSNFVLPNATPSTPMSSNGWAFAGWATSQVTDATETAPAALYNGTTNKYTPTGEDNETLYAVYVKGGEQTLTFDQFAASDYVSAKFVIGAQNTNWYGMLGDLSKQGKGTAQQITYNGTKVTEVSTQGKSIADYTVTLTKVFAEQQISYYTIVLANGNYLSCQAGGTDLSVAASASTNKEKWNKTSNGWESNGNTGSARWIQLSGTSSFGHYASGSYITAQMLPITANYALYHSTPVCCIAPTTPLALQHNGGDDEIALATDGDNYNKALTISAQDNTGNGGSLALDVTPSEGRSIDGQTITFTQAGEYTITATQAKNGDLCAQEAEMPVTIVNEAVTVSYDANGGEGTIAAQNGKKLESLTLSDGFGFERANHGLEKWNTSSDGTGTDYAKSAKIESMPGSLLLYAVWKEVVSYDITKAATFTNGDVTISPAKTYAGETVTLTPTPVTGYTLVSISATYMENEQATSLALTKTNDGKYTFTMPAAAVTVNAVFAKAAKYAVASKSSVNIVEGYTYPDGASATFANTASSNNNQMTSGTTMTLTLSGYEAKQIKGVILNMTSSQSSAGAKGGMTITVGTTQIAAIAEQTEFGGWYNTKSKYNVDKFSSSTFYNVNVALTNNNYIVKEDEKIVIYLKANENSLYCDNFTIFYDDAVIPTHTLTMGVVTGGIISVTDKNNQAVIFTDNEATINEGALIKLDAQAETDNNYKFDEWNVSGVTVANNQFKMPAGDVTLNAVFSQYYKYKYDVDGEVSDETEVKKDAEFTLAVAPTKDYYDFAGWKVGETSTILAAGASTSISANTTFTATWTPKTYTLGVDKVGQGSIVVTVGGVETTPVEGYIQNIPYGTAITATATEASGWVFSNWYAMYSTIEPTNKTISFNMPGNDEQIQATFVELQPHQLTLVTSDYYTLTATDKDGNPIADLNNVMAGSKVNVTYNITGNADFKNWSLYDDELNIFDAYTTQDKTVTFNMPNKTLNVEVDLNKYYTVTLEATNGYFSKLRINHGTIIEDVPSSYVVYENDTIKLEAAANEHCEKPTWYTTRHESEFHCSKNQAYAVVKEDFTIEVRYSVIPQYELKLHAFGQVVKTIQGYRDEGLLDLIGSYSAPSMANYTFKGWSWFADDDEYILDDNVYKYVLEDEDVDLYAIYSTQVLDGTCSYEKVSTAPADWTGTYLIVYENGNVAFDGSRTNGDNDPIDAANNTINVTINNYKISGTDAINAAVVNIAKIANTSSYTVKTASGYYIGRTATSYGLTTNKSTVIQTHLSLNDGNFIMKTCDGSSYYQKDSKDLYLQFNDASNESRFRCYTGGQKNVQIYKQVANYSEQVESTPTTTISSETNASAVFTGGYAGNVVVEDNGKLTIDNALHANSIVIKSTCGSGNGKSANKATCGQVVINGGSFANLGEAYVELTIDKSDQGASYGWYAFSVPFPVDLRTGVYGKSSYNFGDEDWHALTLETHYAIMDYQGDVRAQGKYGWIKTAKHASTLQPGVFYLITVADTDFGTLRFKKTDDAAVISSTGVQTYTYAKSGEGLDTDAGWNGVGNPNIAISQYVDQDGASTLQFYDHSSNSFTGYGKGEINVVVGSAFFVQVNRDKEITMKINETDSRGYRAPAREDENEPQKFAVQLLHGNDMEDQLFVSATETATATYEIGHDVAKAFMDGDVKCAQLYVEAYATKLCDAEFPLNANNEAQFPLTITAPEAGQYQLYVNRAMNGATLYLYQNGSLIWNLSQGAYPISLAKGINSTYTLVLKADGHGIGTGAAEIGVDIDGIQKFIYDEHLILIRDGKMYNAAGALMNYTLVLFNDTNDI